MVPTVTVCGVPQKLIRVIKGLYTGRTGELTIDGASSTMKVNGGTCQGALLAPRLFSYYIYVILEIWLSDNSECLSEMLCGDGDERRSIFLSLFNVADDTAAIFPSRKSLEKHGRSLIHLLQDFGLTTHLSTAETVASNEKPKTVVLHIPPQGPRRHDTVDLRPIEMSPTTFITIADSYVYVGVLIHKSLSDEPEIERRLLLANKHVGCVRKKVLSLKTTHPTTKKLVYEGMVLAILLYGAETWIVTAKMERKLTAFHRRVVRIMCNVNMFTVRRHNITATSLEKRLDLRTARD